MRIAAINFNNRRIGGVETYLSTVLPALMAQGHQVGLWTEMDSPKDRASIGLPDGAASWCVAELGATRALSELREWKPDIIYTHKVENPELEALTQMIAPSVFFIHDYYGTCISGNKTFKFPVVKPCDRRFGWQCLLHYFPRRCGGRNPITMLKLYQLQSNRLALLRRYDAVVTHSAHMLRELLNHGLSALRVHSFPYYVNPQSNGSGAKAADGSNPVLAGDESKSNYRFLFSGRMEFLKGGHVFLDALPHVAQMLGKPVQAVMAGDGRERQKLEQQAAQLQVRHRGVNIEFTGWLGRDRLDALLEQSDLLVMPSLWPEPFGLAGPEAGMQGVPVAAFDVGGIPSWLTDGINGALAPGNPPTAAGLAQAIVRCVHHPLTLNRLRLGAMEMAQQFNVKDHLVSLLQVFNQVIERRQNRI